MIAIERVAWEGAGYTSAIVTVKVPAGEWAARWWDTNTKAMCEAPIVLREAATYQVHVWYAATDDAPAIGVVPVVKGTARWRKGAHGPAFLERGEYPLAIELAADAAAIADRESRSARITEMAA